MIDSIQNIKRNFFQLFLGEDGDKFLRDYVSITDIDDNEVLQVPFNYLKKSSVDYSELDYVKYPIISVQDFMPIPIEGWNNYPLTRYAGLQYDSDEVVGVYKYPHAVRLSCKYDVSIAAKKDSDFTAMVNFMYGKFGMGVDETLSFNTQNLGGHVIADYVTCKVRAIETPVRADGVYEGVFSFDLHLWANLRPISLQADLLNTIQVEFNQV